MMILTVPLVRKVMGGCNFDRGSRCRWSARSWGGCKIGHIRHYAYRGANSNGSFLSWIYIWDWKKNHVICRHLAVKKKSHLSVHIMNCHEKIMWICIWNWNETILLLLQVNAYIVIMNFWSGIYYTLNFLEGLIKPCRTSCMKLLFVHRVV